MSGVCSGEVQLLVHLSDRLLDFLNNNVPIVLPVRRWNWTASKHADNPLLLVHNRVRCSSETLGQRCRNKWKETPLPPVPFYHLKPLAPQLLQRPNVSALQGTDSLSRIPSGDRWIWGPARVQHW